jgi:uncharacterized protein YwqG
MSYLCNFYSYDHKELNNIYQKKDKLLEIEKKVLDIINWMEIQIDKLNSLLSRSKLYFQNIQNNIQNDETDENIRIQHIIITLLPSTQKLNENVLGENIITYFHQKSELFKPYKDKNWQFEKSIKILSYLAYGRNFWSNDLDFKNNIYWYLKYNEVKYIKTGFEQLENIYNNWEIGVYNKVYHLLKSTYEKEASLYFYYEKQNTITQKTSINKDIDLSHLPNKDTILIDITDVKPTNIRESKIGGFPYMSENIELPKNHEWVNLRLLVQINCSELPQNNVFPTEGILQFFIDASDDLMWCEFGSTENTWWYKVIYHWDTSLEQSKQEYYSKLEDVYMPFQFSEDKYYKVQFNISNKDIPWYNSIESYDFEDDENLFDHLDENYNWTKLTWYPAFTQNDIRQDINDKNDLILLLQLDSHNSNWKIMVWDSWVMNFFIRKNDLQNLNFENVIYNWDCV